MALPPPVYRVSPQLKPRSAVVAAALAAHDSSCLFPVSRGRLPSTTSMLTNACTGSPGRFAGMGDHTSEVAVAEQTAAAVEESAPAVEQAVIAKTQDDAGDEDLYYKPQVEYVSGKVDDLAELTNLNEDVLMKELKIRYGEGHIYTFLSDILIAINPYKRLSIYDQEAHDTYQQKQRWEAPPHIFAIADRCYSNFFDMNKNQCVVISGESGAGKTESAKFVVKHIIHLCGARGVAAPNNLEKQIIESSPLLEAFGNAQTVMNDNSSRFGKYTRLLFDNEGEVLGIQLSEYLLEKSRVIEQAAGERNFHILYYLFSMPTRERYFLTGTIADYHCLGGQLWDDNAAMYQEVVNTLRLLGFSEEDEQQLYSVLAAVVHLGNLNFIGTEAAYVKDDGPLDKVSQLLQVPKAKLTEVLLSIESIARGERIVREYKPSQAYDCRDALAKALYAGMFGWIVNSINTLLAPSLANKSQTFEIGVLDIFGFECFAVNSFEQLCINVAHEQLQFFFNRHTFSLELAEYAAEGIDTTLVSFKDNEPVLRMVMDRPIGLFALLDEESGFPQASPASLVDKLVANLSDRAGFKPVKMMREHPSFAIEHFAGLVEYSGATFLEKNRDNLAPNIVDLVQSSGVQLVRDVFMGEVLGTGQIRPQLHTKAAVNSKVNRVAPMLSVQFRNSLTVLVDRMNKCYPHFVRCIKPNLYQRPNDFQGDLVSTQLRYTGVLEVTRIRQEGFSWRPDFADFVRRYKIIAFPVLDLDNVPLTAESAVKIIQASKLEKWAVGKTKLFLKFYHLAAMEARLQRFYVDVVRAQSSVRRRFAVKILRELQRRAQLELSERLALERADAEERQRREDEKRRKELEVYQARQAELARLAEIAAVEKKAAEERAAEAARLHKDKETELEEARLAAMNAAAEARRLEERREADITTQQADLLLQEAQQMLLERQHMLEAAEIARQAAREHELAMAELARDLEEARKAKTEAEAEAAKIQRDRLKSRRDRSRKAAEEAQAAQLLAEEEARLAEEARKAQEETQQKQREEEEMRKAEEARMAMMKEEELHKALSDREERARRAKEEAEEQARRVAEAQAAREAAEAHARLKAAEREEELKRIAEEKEKEEAELRTLDWKRPEFNLSQVVLTLLNFQCASKGYLLLMKTHNVARSFFLRSTSSAPSWKRRFVVLDLTTTGTIQVYDNEKLHTLKETYALDSVVRVYSPQVRSRPEATRSIERLFVIELTQRSFYCQAVSEESMQLWITALNAVTQATRSIRRNSRASMFFDAGSRASMLIDPSGSGASVRSAANAASAASTGGASAASASSAGSALSLSSDS